MRRRFSSNPKVSGLAPVDSELWNGEYYVQREPPVDKIVEVDHGTQPWHSSAYEIGRASCRERVYSSV